MAYATVILTVSQLVHGRMLPVDEPVQIPESFAAEFIRKGIATRAGPSIPKSEPAKVEAVVPEPTKKVGKK